MSGERDPWVYLDDVLDAAKKAREFSAGFSFEQFEADEKTVYAVVRALEIVGEASKQELQRSGISRPKFRGV